MTVKQQLISEIETIDNSVILVQLYEIIHTIKQNISQPKFKQPLLQFMGCINDADAEDMRNIINNRVVFLNLINKPN